MKTLLNKQVIVGITGGIAAYKSADLVRRLIEAGCDVEVVMTKSATEFITPLTLQALSGREVHQDLFGANVPNAMEHITLARWADLIVIAPASADFIARLNQGRADDLLTTLCLATTAPIAVAPAMNQQMWRAKTTQDNIADLQGKGFFIFGPGAGEQACGDIGLGRLLEPVDIVEKSASVFKQSLLSGIRVLITAGPTREPIDPVRYISNYSSGKMGFALARACAELDAKVTLVSGPVNLETPDRVARHDVVTAAEMYQVVMAHLEQQDIVIATAAVADYFCETVAESKLASKQQHLTLKLAPTKDIVKAITHQKNRPYVVAFAAETDAVVTKAKDKLHRKKADMIIANQVGIKDQGFDSDNNQVSVLWHDECKDFPKMSKQALARQLMVLIMEHYHAKN